MIKEKAYLTEIEEVGLTRMKNLNQAFLNKNKASKEVVNFMTKVEENEVLMLAYLRGRKYRPDYAWETLNRHGTVRFDQYPEVFADKPAHFHNNFQDIGLFGVLKRKDDYGRTVICITGSKWNTSDFDMTDITNSMVTLLNNMLLDRNVLENGIVFAINCEGMGLHYASYFGLNVMTRLLNVLWFACPLRIKGIYFMNVHIGLLFLHTLINPFLPKKIKKRLFITTANKKYEMLHRTVNPEILPESFGGLLNYKDAYDLVKYRH